jgi:hypothetical protein
MIVLLSCAVLVYFDRSSWGVCCQRADYNTESNTNSGMVSTAVGNVPIAVLLTATWYFQPQPQVDGDPEWGAKRGVG